MLTPAQLEDHLLPIDYFVTHTKLEQYGAIMYVLANSNTPCGVGYHRDYGWFVLRNHDPERLDEGPTLLWSERSPP